MRSATTRSGCGSATSRAPGCRRGSRLQLTLTKIVLITGATDGLGRALADRLAAGGATVLRHGRADADLSEMDGVTGRYFDGLIEARAHPQAYRAEARRRLRELSEQLT